MFILKNNISIRVVCILLLILILMQYLQLIFQLNIYPHLSYFTEQANPNIAYNPILSNVLMKKDEGDQNISFSYILNEHSKNCYYRWRNYFFTINSCEKWQLGTVLTIFGNYRHASANPIFEQIRLNIQSIEPVSMGGRSVKGSIPQMFTQIQKILWFTFNIKSFLLQKNTQWHTLQTEQIVRAMVFGDKSLIDPSIHHYFEVTGTLHVLAVSGMHVGLLHLLLTHVTSRFWAALRFFSQAVSLEWYAITVGFGPSIARASTMLILSLITFHILKRQKQSWYVLFIVVACLLFLNDWYLFMVGFQLSVLATASIIGLQMYRRQLKKSNSSSTYLSQEDSNENAWSILFASVQTSHNVVPKFNKISREKYSKRQSLHHILFKQVCSYVREICILSGFIQLMLAPLLWIHFGHLSWVGFIAAPVLMWLVPPVFLFALVAFGIALLSSVFVFIGIPIIGDFLELFRILSSFFLEMLVHIFIFLLGGIAKLFEPIAIIEFHQFSIFSAVIWYSCLFSSLALFSWIYRRKYKDA